MKKIISLALSLSMLACMATNAFAADPETKPVVGTHGDNKGTENSLLDGVDAENFGNGDSETTINIKVSTGNLQHRYAVDVEYTDVVLSLNGGDRTWDVNQLKYVYTSANTQDGNAWTPTFKIKNYSDLSVYVKAEVNRSNQNDGLVITKTGMPVGTDGITNEVREANGWNEISSAVPTGNDTVGSVKSLGFKLSVALDNNKTWNDVANAHADEIAASNDGTAIVATFTVKVAKQIPNS